METFILHLTLAILSFFPPGDKTHTKTSFKDGDIIFQSSKSGQSLAIQLATHSIYSHCGIILVTDNKYYVVEALQPVVVTPLEDFTARGDNNYYVVKRLKDRDAQFTPDAISKMKAFHKKNIGKPYDFYFGWSDDKIYCSELVWKMYKESTGLEVGKLKKLKEFDLTHPAVKEKLKERYGKNVPMEEPVISPESIFNSELLITVGQKGIKPDEPVKK
jgi:uncharacterized protein YycO